MRITFTCESCGSKLITRDAWAEWDEEQQKWVLRAALDYVFCHGCKREANLRERALPPN